MAAEDYFDLVDLDDYMQSDVDREMERYERRGTMPKTKAKTAPRKRAKANAEALHPHRYYTGASHIARAFANNTNDIHTRATLEDAIEHAKSRMEDEGLDEAIVVKIVAVVKRATPPVVIRRLKD